MPETFYRVILFFSIIFTFSPTMVVAQDHSGYSQFYENKREQYPPYSSAEAGFGRFSLITGHVVHSVLYGALHGQGLSEGLDLKHSYSTIIGMGSNLPTFIDFAQRKVYPNAIWLNHHWENLGFFHGMSLSVLVQHETYFSRGTLTFRTIGSMALGTAGYYFGRKKNWDQNRVSLYKHYGTMGTLLGSWLPTLGKGKNPQIRAIGSLIGTAGGYYYAHEKAKTSDKTRGDYVATDAFTLFNAYYWFTATSRVKQLQENGVTNFLLPTLLTIGSSTLNQHWVRNARLSRLQSKGLIFLLAGTTGIYRLYDAGGFGSFENNLGVMAGTYLLGGLAYRYMLKEMKAYNLNRRDQKLQETSLSFSPFNPTLIQTQQAGQGNLNLKQGLSPSLRLKMTF